MVTRRQHYVWRHYLQMWQGRGGSVSCLRDNKIFGSNPINIMVERDFYKLQLLTQKDIFILRELLLRPTTMPHLRQLHEDLIEKFALIARANERLQAHPKASDTDREMARKWVIETEERLHCEVERGAQPILETLRNKDANVICSEESAVLFFHFISHQYFRTGITRDLLVEAAKSIPTENMQRIRNLLCFCFATNVGGSLYVDQHGWEIIFLDCSVGSEFITGGQPIINILDNRDGKPPKHLALYYPLSPDLAMILAPKSLKLRGSLTQLDFAATQELNDLIAWKSRQYLVSRSPDQLKRYQFKSYIQPPPLSFLPDIR